MCVHVDALIPHLAPLSLPLQTEKERDGQMLVASRSPCPVDGRTDRRCRDVFLHCFDIHEKWDDEQQICPLNARCQKNPAFMMMLTTKTHQ